MSVRVVARIRPLLAKESDKDIIVQAENPEAGKPTTVVKIPNPQDEDEEFSFTFNGVYDQSISQEDLFASEVAPHIKSLFQGTDITIFAYGVTGTGKTHTMRGGMKLADRGVIPRLLSAIFRRGRKLAKETEGDTTVQVALSYYEIYNDKIYDLLESQEQRTPAGLPLRTDANGKTEVVGLMERDCSDLKDFEKLYIEANNNRVTAATKLNTCSSRSHAILRVKLTQTTGDEVRESIASAIDLAGSEDNRRTDNGKEILVESAAINKSLFVLSQCIDAIARGDKRIPYRESKMTRILSLGQNDGITIMILNLSPLRCCHLDTLSSLNISSRAKRIEAREIENEVVFKQVPRTTSNSSGAGGLLRQPLRPLANAINALNVHSGNAVAKATEVAKPVKAFSVFSDKVVKSATKSQPLASTPQAPTRPPKRPLDAETASRPTKLARPTRSYHAPLKTPQTRVKKRQRDSAASVLVSTADIEAMVEKKVSEILAARDVAEKPAQTPSPNAIQRRLAALERRIGSEESRDDAKSEGLRHLLKARQAKESGDETAALRAYEMALPYFPDQVRLIRKIEKLRKRLGLLDGRSAEPKDAVEQREEAADSTIHKDTVRGGRWKEIAEDKEGETQGEKEERSRTRSKSRNRRSKQYATTTPSATKPKKATLAVGSQDKPPKPATPRTRQLLEVVNSGDRARIRGLVGFGPKKAQALVARLELARAEGSGGIESLSELRALPGLGGRAVDRAYEGLCGAST